MFVSIWLLERILSIELAAYLWSASAAIIIFVFRAMPSPGAGLNWFEIDILGFNQSFFSLLSITSAFITLVGMIVLRNVGDELYTSNPNWFESINLIKLFSKISLTMAMAAIGLSTNLKDIKSMGYKPFIVGFIAMLTVGIVCILPNESYLRFFI